MQRYNIAEFSREQEKIFLQKSRLYIENQLPEHIHSDFLEIIYILEGRGYHFANGKKSSVKKGDLLFLSHANSHTMRASSNDFLWVDIGFQPYFLSKKLHEKYGFNEILHLQYFEEYQEVLFDDSIDIILNDVQFEFEYLVLEMYNEYISGYSGYLQNLHHYLIVLLAKLFRYKQSNKGLSYHKSDMFIDFVTKELEAHHYCGINMGKIAQEFCMSYKYFSRVFREHVGMRFTEFLHKKRIEKACELLVHSQDSIADISVKVGFNEEKSFYRNFRNVTGKTPRQYRQEFKK